MKYDKIYVLSPADTVTGGPDALHQMVFYLKKIGCDASIVYFKTSSCTTFSIPEPYKNYITSFKCESEIIDDEKNAVIIPENYTKKCDIIKKCHIFIWWLSVDFGIVGKSFISKIFFFSTLPLRILLKFSYYKRNSGKAVTWVLNSRKYSFKNENPKIEHLCASYYAYDFVKCKSKNKVVLCIEPISKYLLEKFRAYRENTRNVNRLDVILYNPKKTSCSFIQKIESYANDLEFEPLQGMTQQQLIDKYKSSKLYIDFGPFPGAERIPKEAVLFGCSIITGRRGASNFYGDVPIPDEYKFEDPESQIDEIVAKIRFVLGNYEKVYSDFEEYRKTVLNLEDSFIKSLKNIFG